MILDVNRLVMNKTTIVISLNQMIDNYFKNNINLRMKTKAFKTKPTKTTNGH